MTAIAMSMIVTPALLSMMTPRSGGESLIPASTLLMSSLLLLATI